MKGVIRPEKRILPDAAAVPAKNVVAVPRRFTHEVVSEQPFYYAARATEPAGSFPPGSQVRVAAEGRTRSRVVDARGLSVYTASAGLRPLDPADP